MTDGASLRALCDEAELAVDAAVVAQALGLALSPEVPSDPVARARDILARGESCVLLCTRTPSDADTVTLADLARAQGNVVILGLLEPSSTVQLARDLGAVAVVGVRPALAAAALLPFRAHKPWLASARGLGGADRAQLHLSPGHRGAGRFTRQDAGLLAYETEGGALARVGEPRDIAAALDAYRAAEHGERLSPPAVEGVDTAAVMDVIFGPARALSDPASKAALAYFDLPLPLEELCASASRAASEAQRIGFPVRVALASPDLRIGDHPDLALDGVDSATRTRDAFRQIMALAKNRASEDRLLGVTVSAATQARALLRVKLVPMPAGLVRCELEFADPHGVASGDGVRTFLPRSRDGIGRVLDGLRGRTLLYPNDAERRVVVEEVGDVLMRLAAFLHAFREYVRAVEINPLAVLVGGEVEVREACVVVGDAFERSMLREHG
ncbi:MAG: acetate--CoA ligase family protein [Polyangiales bacterium]|nr:acetate--CoA ligase family protein [Myxococcales bacterium]MCB9658586.1 acetate--CoA ligase family protein [Sandaracinaceae bacterium]